MMAARAPRHPMSGQARPVGAVSRPNASSLLEVPCGPGMVFEAGTKRWQSAVLRECRVEAPSAIGSAVISAPPVICCICARKHDDNGAIIGDGSGTAPVLQQAEEIFK